MARNQSSDHRNLDGIYTEFIRNLYGIYTEIKSLTKVLDENALEYLASGKGFILDRLRLDILTIIFTRIFNYNLSVISVCSVDFFWIIQKTNGKEKLLLL